MRYAVKFTRESRARTDKPTAVAKLSKIYNKNPQEIEKLFYSGVGVTVKRFASREEAQALQASLRQHGIHTEILEQPAGAGHDAAGDDRQGSGNPGETTEDRADPGPADASPPIDTGRDATGRKSRWPLIVMGCAVLVLVVLLGCYVWLSGLLKPRLTVNTTKAENALFSQGAALMGFVDVGRLVDIEAMLAPSAPNQPFDPAGTDFLSVLRTSGIDVRAQLDHIILALHADETLPAYMSMALIGTFAKGDARRFFERYYETAEHNGVLLFKKQDRDTCEYSAERAVVIRDGLILISHPDRIATVVERFDAAEETSQLSAEWQAYRANHLVSIGAMQPKDSAQAVPGFMGFILAGMLGRDSPLDEVYIGMQGRALPPAMILEASLQSGDNNWLQQTADKANKAIIEQSAAVDDSPELVKMIYDTLAVQQSGSAVEMRMEITGEFVEQARITFAQGLGSLISFGDANDTDVGAGELASESVDTSAEAYPATVDIKTLEPYGTNYGPAAQWQQGPVGLVIKAVRVTEAGLTEIDLEAKTAPIPNLPDATLNPVGELVINQVKGRDGGNLLRNETCGEQINSDPVRFEATFSDRVTAVKSIRLKEGVTADQVASVDGHYRIKFADRTRVQLLPAPIESQVYLDGKLTIDKALRSKLKVSATPGSDLVDLRPMNPDKQYLHSSSFSFGQDDEGGKARSVSYSVSGELGFVELTRAEHWTVLENEFSIPSGMPGFPEHDGVPYVPPSAVTAEQWQTMVEEVAMLSPQPQVIWQSAPEARHTFGPVLMDIYPFEFTSGYKSPMLSGRAVLYAPYLESLSKLANPVAVTLESIVLSNGETYVIDGATWFKLSADTLYEQNAADSQYPHERYGSPLVLKTSEQIIFPVPEAPKMQPDLTVVGARGQLRIITPQTISEHRYELNQPGFTVTLPNLEIELREVGAEGFKFRVQGDPTSLVDILLLNEDGNLVSQNLALARPSAFDDEFGSLDFFWGKVRATGAPAELLILTAESVTAKDDSWALGE